ncbi:hypothetical protein [Solirubrobacter soli]|uniref:hypothetical protein n=1 Tax=Solirubrobacter soli TaxID=363832 RepID=UPI0004292233|nr:hypothetical protein [Solirubrobacter soli]
MKRVLAAVLITALASIATTTATAQPDVPAKVTLKTFTGQWTGHTRQLKIFSNGTARESVDDGCCTHVYTVRYKLSNPRGTKKRPVITATITSAEVPDPSLFSKTFPEPKVGQKTQFTIKYTDAADILTTKARKATYCRNGNGTASPCGA